jgi:serine protease Do
MKNKINNGIIILFAFVLGGLSMYYFSLKNRVVVTQEGEKVEVTNTCKSCNSTVIMENGSLAASVEKTVNTVVMVKTYNGAKAKGSGSGFIYKIEGDSAYIMTNHHVVDGGNKWTVITSTDEEIEGTVLGSDEYVDIAVIKVKKKDYMEAATILPSNTKVNLGDTVFTIGAPVGYEYRGTVTNGIISGLNRLVEVGVKSSLQGDYVMEVIQTNAAVNPGNSGGPLFNANGEVVGVISMKLVENSIEGMGFAIPIDYAMSHVNKLEKGEKIDRPLIGISMANVTDTYLLFQNRIIVPDGVEEGVVVVEISSDSGASKSDLQKGDVITKLNGSTVKNAAYLKYLLYKYNPGDTVTITYNRNGKISTTKITLTKNEG